MKRKGMGRFLAFAVAASLLVTGCSDGQTAGDSGSVVTEKDEAESGDAVFRVPEWTKTAVLYEVNLRQYTKEGSFAAFGEHLEELKKMGINTLWFMPIHPISETNRIGSLGSYYSISDYREVNPEFGTKEDFKALVDQAHEMGFHVLMDWVANHTGWDHAWISEHPDWYTQQNGEIISPEGTGWNDVADLNYDNPDMMKEMISCMEYWVSEFDIDGYRCDYAPGVPKNFWETARVHLDKIKLVYMLEEDLGWLSEGLLDHAFDTNYNSKVYETLWEIARDNKQADKLRLYLPKMPEGTFPMNYLDNHDVNSYDRTIMEAFGKDALPAMFSVIFTLPGIPMVYSGDEIGYDKAMEFMDKDPIDWESSDVSYRELIGILSEFRQEYEPLYAGPYGGGMEVVKNDNKNILTFTRTRGDRTMVCVFNLSKREQEADLSEAINGKETVLLHGGSGSYERGGSMPAASATLAPWEFYIAER